MSECEFKYHLPWEPISAGGTYASNLRIDLVGSLRTFMDMPRPVPTPLTSAEMNVTIDILNKAIVSAYGACFLHVASRMREVLLSSEWASPPSTVSPADEQAVFDSISGQMFWLCSVANDAAFYNEHVRSALESSAAEMKAVQDKVKAEIAKYGKDHVSSNTERQMELSMSVDIVLHESKESFEDVRKVAVDFLSCIIFKSFIDLLVQNSSSEWISLCRSQSPGGDAGITRVGVGISKMSTTDDSARKETSPVDAVVESIVLDFESYRQYVDQCCYENLVKICAEKFVLRYYGLLRMLVAEKIVISAQEDIDRMRDELNKISKCLCRALRTNTSSDEGKYTLIVTKFGLLYDALSLIEYESESEQFIEKMLKIKNFAHNNPDLAMAVSTFVRVCVSLKPDSANLFDDKVSVIPSLCDQIQSYSTLEPPPAKEKKKRTSSEGSDEFQDLEAVAEAAAAEARKKQLRPDPLELVFGHSAISLFPTKIRSNHTPRRSKFMGKLVGSGGHVGDHFTGAIVDEKIKGALLNCSLFYQARPRAVTATTPTLDDNSAHDMKVEAVLIAPTTEGKMSTDHSKKSSFFSSMFTKQRHERSTDASDVKSANIEAGIQKSNILSKPTAICPAPPYIDVTEIVARNLFSTDTLFSSIPNSFVQLALGRSSVNSEVVNNNADPRWADPRMKLPVPLGFVGDAELVISLFYKKRLGKPDLIGTVTILLAKFEAASMIDDVYEVNFSDSSEHVVNCFVKSTASGVPAPTIRVIASLIKN